MLRNKNIFFSVLIMALILLISVAGVWADKGGLSISPDDKFSTYNKSDVEMKVEPTIKYERASHTANGTYFRNRISGTIQLRGVPAGSNIMAGYLYFTFLSEKDKGPETFPILFNGNKIIAVKTADSAAPCWGSMVGCHTYRANVTPYILDTQATTNVASHPNQDYQVVLQFDSSTATSGENPWINSPAPINTEGATLILVYYHPEYTQGPLYIYDNLYNSMFNNSGVFYLIHDPFETSAIFTMAGADGQLNLPNELTFFNKIQIAGCPVTNSDWDGSAGWPLPQLWDTVSHSVIVEGDVSMVNYVANGDCLVPAVFILDLQ